MPTLVVGVAVLLLATPAQAAFEITSFVVDPSSLAAGTHPDVRIAATFGRYPNPPPRDLLIHLPPGLVGNPQATPRCPRAMFAAGACPPETQIGTSNTTATALVTVLGLPVEVAVGAPGEVYNLTPEDGEAARLGITAHPQLPFGLPASPVRLEAPVTLRPESGALDALVRDLPTRVSGQPIWIDSVTMTLSGRPAGASAPFVTLPTACVPATATVEATPHGEGAAALRAAAPFTPTDCDGVPFSPAAAVNLEMSRRGAPSGYAVALELPGDDVPVRQAHVRRAEIVLPGGTTLSPGVASAGLQACGSEQFAAGTCPEGSQIGELTLATPLLGAPLRGQVFLAEPRAERPLGLLVVVADRRAPLKLEATVRADPASGRVTVVFDDLPQLPFTSLQLSLRGGARAVLANPAGCGSHAVTARLTPWSAAPQFAAARDVTAVNSFTIDADGAGGACAEPQFRPQLDVHAASTQAGAPTGALTLTVARPDGERELERFAVELPGGLAGAIAGIPVCPEDRVAVGDCPRESRIGSVTATIGPGAQPLALDGAVYLTGPAEGGLLGLAIVIPARVGPLDLGTVVTRAGISLRPSDAGLSVRTGELPRIVGGVPVSIRTLSLTLDGMLNPTSCAELSVRASLTAVGGASADAAAPYRATGCDALAFAPRLSASVGAPGQVRKDAKPPLRTVIAGAPGQANLRAVSVALPPALGVDLTRLRAVCGGPELDAGTCPPASRVGRAEAHTPVLPAPLTGDIVLARRASSGLPGLAVLLRSSVRLTLEGSVALTAQGLRVSFEGVPDVPLSRLELAFDGGRAGALQLTRDPCRGPAPVIAADFQAHSGKRAGDRRTMAVAGCPRTPRAALAVRGLSGRRPTLRLAVSRARGAAPLRRLRLRLPRSLRVDPRRAARGLLTRSDGRPAPRRAARLARSGVLTVWLPGRGARSVTVRLGGGGFTASSPLRRVLRARPRLDFRLETTAADGYRSTQRLRMRASR